MNKKLLKIIGAVLLVPTLLFGNATSGFLAVIAKKNAGSGTGSPGTAAVVAWWSMDESSGNAIDSSANSNDATDVNTVGDAAGLVGGASGARDFVNTSDEAFQIADASAGDFEFGDSDWSIALWVSHDAAGANQVYISKYKPSGGQREFMLRFENGNDVPDLRVSSDGIEAIEVENTSASGMTSSGGWYFVYCYHDAAANEIGISTDDGTVDTASHSGGIFGGTADLFIGRSDGSLTTDLDGQLDEVAVFSKRLSADEVTWLYNAGAGRAFSDL